MDTDEKGHLRFGFKVKRDYRLGKMDDNRMRSSITMWKRRPFTFDFVLHFVLVNMALQPRDFILPPTVGQAYPKVQGAHSATYGR
jgi:hypothetical protein